MVFKDVSTFDAENPIVGSLLNELDLKKKGTGSDFMKNLPSQPGKDFEIIKSLDRLKGITPFLKDNNNNNNNSNGGPSPVRPILPPFIDPRPPPLPPGPSGFNLFQPPPPDPFPSRGRIDPPPPPPAPSFNNFGNINL